jgi:dsDNA-binding SOS-regulon protein
MINKDMPNLSLNDQDFEALGLYLVQRKCNVLLALGAGAIVRAR